MFTKLDDDIFVSVQITVDQVTKASDMGITLIVNNRPDGESVDQTEGAIIAAACNDVGIEYKEIPITHAGFSAPQVDAMIAALEDNNIKGGKILAYCRSGTRSTFLWSLAKAKMGESPSEIARIAGNAGYDISPVSALVDALSGHAN